MNYSQHLKANAPVGVAKICRKEERNGIPTYAGILPIPNLQ